MSRKARRNSVNRYFARIGCTNINVNQKPWCEGPYGRERAFVGETFTNRNKLTTDATARLLADIVTGHAVSTNRSAEMLKLMERDLARAIPGVAEPDQAADFTASGLPKGARLWSKAGWTSTTRHDAAYVELPGGAKFVLVVFTIDHANEREIIPTVAREILARWR